MTGQGGSPKNVARRPRVCIAAAEVIGPFRNGGIGTSYTALSMLLARSGWDVTILYLSDAPCDRSTWEDWVEHYARRGVRLIPLPPASVPTAKSPLLQTSYRVYEFLKRERFDVVHFHEWMGAGCYSLSAKRQGLRFQDVYFCVGVHSPTLWLREANEEFVSSAGDYEADAMEQSCVAAADAVWFPSEYLRRWTADRGWRTSGAAFVRSHAALVDEAVDGASTMASPTAARIEELVFFGRLETRKGAAVFCDAVERLAAEIGPEAFRVALLGKPALIHGRPAREYLAERTASWRFHWNVLDRCTTAEAIDYLRRPGRLAVIPSLTENLPLVVAECLQHRIPFVAADVGGIPEMIRPDDRDRVLTKADGRSLAARLLDVLRVGAAPAAPANEADRIDAQWVRWHADVRSSAVGSPAEPGRPLPLVSVCLVHFDRPVLLRQALASIEAQEYSPLEVVLVDDGSTTSEAHETLRELEPTFASRGWKIIHQENRYLGAARNAAARSAAGEYLLFMDDDNLAKPGEIATMVAVAQHAGADVVGSLMDVFEGLQPPGDDQPPSMRWLFPPADVRLGALLNCFGDANALVRREAFVRLGGFTEDFGVTHEDWEFFARAHLGGCRFEMIPEALFWYRFAAGSMLRATSERRNFARSLRPYLERIPAELRPLLELTLGQHRRIELLTDQIRRLEERLGWLRYRVADRVNGAVKRLPWIHPLLKRTLNRRRDRPTKQESARGGDVHAGAEAPGGAAAPDSGSSMTTETR